MDCEMGVKEIWWCLKIKKIKEKDEYQGLETLSQTRK